MKYRKLDALGDYTFGTGFDFYKDEKAAVAQAIKTRLDLWKGEWFLDVKDGTPWLTEALGKYTLKTYDAMIRSRILGTQGVRSIIDYQSKYDGLSRKVSVTATVDTIYGQYTYSGAI